MNPRDMKNLRSPFRLWTVIGLSMGVAASSSAAVVVNLSTLINGSPPVGSPPYLSAQIETVSIGSVNFTLTNNLPTYEFVDNWLFNINSSSTLTFTHTGGVAALTTSGSNFSNGGSNMKAGLFDIEFHFPSENSDPFRFHGGEFSTYNVTGFGIVAEDFLSLSVDDLGSPPSQGGWISAGHIQGIPGDLSGSIGTAEAVPEPSTIALLGFAAIALLKKRRS